MRKENLLTPGCSILLNCRCMKLAWLPRGSASSAGTIGGPSSGFWKVTEFLGCWVWVGPCREDEAFRLGALEKDTLESFFSGTPLDTGVVPGFTLSPPCPPARDPPGVIEPSMLAVVELQAPRLALPPSSALPDPPVCFSCLEMIERRLPVPESLLHSPFLLHFMLEIGATLLQPSPVVAFKASTATADADASAPDALLVSLRWAASPGQGVWVWVALEEAVGRGAAGASSVCIRQGSLLEFLLEAEDAAPPPGVKFFILILPPPPPPPPPPPLPLPPARRNRGC